MLLLDSIKHRGVITQDPPNKNLAHSTA